MAEKKTNPEEKGVHLEGGVYIRGNVTAGRDVVQGDQYNYHYAPHDFQITNIQTPAEFTAKLAEVRAEIALLKQQSDLTSAQKRNIEAAEQQVVVVLEETQKETPDENSIKATLTEAKETFELLSGSIAAAAGLGAVLGNLIAMAVQIF